MPQNKAEEVKLIDPKCVALKIPAPVLTAHLLPEVLQELVRLLEGLDANEWQQPTVCAGWDVKDVALHLLGGEIGNLSRRRDGHSLGANIQSWDELVVMINRWNAGWVEQARRMSSRMVIDLLGYTGRQMADYFAGLEMDTLGPAVSWAGSQAAPVWLDVAREYTERWHHQQHIRDAVEKPGLTGPRYLAPALAAFVHALPRAYAQAAAGEGTALVLRISGESGGCWSLVRAAETWQLYAGAAQEPAAEVEVDEDTAWRLFTHGIDPQAALRRMTLSGNQELGRQVLQMVAIIA